MFQTCIFSQKCQLTNGVFKSEEKLLSRQDDHKKYKISITYFKVLDEIEKGIITILFRDPCIKFQPFTLNEKSELERIRFYQTLEGERPYLTSKLNVVIFIERDSVRNKFTGSWEMDVTVKEVGLPYQITTTCNKEPCYTL